MAKLLLRPRAAFSTLGTLIVAGTLALGCGDGDKPGATADSATPPASAPASSAQAMGPTGASTAPPIHAEPGLAGPGAAPKAAGPGAPTGGSYERAALLAYLPAECPNGRAYLDVQRALGGDNGAVKELVEKLVASTARDKGKAESILAELRAGGLDPATSVRELAACVLEGRQPLVAIGLDTSKAKDPTAVLFKALAASEAEGAVKLIDEGGMKVIKNPRGELMAMLSPSVLVLAKTIDRLKEVAKAPGGTAGFADAPSHVLWMRLTGRERVDVSVAEKGSDYELTGLFPPSGPMISMIKTDPKGVIAAYEKEADERAKVLAGEPGRASPLKNLAPVVKEARWSIEGDRVKVTAKASQALVIESIKVVLATPDQQLFGGFR